MTKDVFCQQRDLQIGFFNTQICFLANKNDNMNSACFILQSFNDDTESNRECKN